MSELFLEPTTYNGTPRVALRQGEGLELAFIGCASPWEALPSCGEGVGDGLEGEAGGQEKGKGGSLVGV